MTKLEFVLNTRTVMNAESEGFDVLAYYEELNKPNTIFIQVGDRVLSKGMIQSILIKDETNEPNVRVNFHNDLSADIYFPNYDAIETTNLLNNAQVPFAALGNLITNRNAVRDIHKL